MKIWNMTRWQDYYNHRMFRSGLRMRYDVEVNEDVRRSVSEFVFWLRKEYTFPKRVCVYVKADRRIKSMKGDMVCGTFFRPADRDREPYIRIATGDYVELLAKWDRDNALAAILSTLAHELTHYFQWLNDLDLTLIGEERQATCYARQILSDYAQTRDHP